MSGRSFRKCLLTMTKALAKYAEELIGFENFLLGSTARESGKFLHESANRFRIAIMVDVCGDQIA